MTLVTVLVTEFLDLRKNSPKLLLLGILLLSKTLRSRRVPLKERSVSLWEKSDRTQDAVCMA
ncbi:MAG: hypothetical protein KME31_23650 [Tolypothrix carrinoi HA7290-LM1]|nr:hypothetical protein [Tolypothrix carrinoi HA7290-LM1]